METYDETQLDIYQPLNRKSDFPFFSCKIDDFFSGKKIKRRVETPFVHHLAKFERLSAVLGGHPFKTSSVKVHPLIIPDFFVPLNIRFFLT